MKKNLSLALSLVMIFSLLCLLSPVASAKGGDTITFSDAALESKVRAQIGKKEGPITIADLEQVDNLNFFNDTREGLKDKQLIHDISDLRYFPNLFALSLFNNAVTDISVLSSLSGLKFLDLGANAITDLSPLSALPLVELTLFGNGLSDISPLARVTSLTRLELQDNAIIDFSPLANLTNLSVLFVRNNASFNYSALAGIAPQLGEKDFEILSSPYDPAEEIVFGNSVFEHRVREFLNMPEGPFTAGDACYATALGLSNSWETEVADDARFVDISPLRYFVNLSELYMNRNKVQDISALKDLTRLQQLHLSDNEVLDFSPLAGLTQLQGLYLDSRGRDIGMLGGLTGLRSLDIGSGNKALPEWLPKLTMLDYFGSAGGEISDISLLANCPSLTALNLGWNRISDLSPLTGLALTRLYLNQNQVSDLSPLAGMPLTRLFLADNPIMDYSSIRAIYDNLQEKDFNAIFADDVHDDPLAFADPNFEKALREALNIHDRPITTRDAYPVTILGVYREKDEGAAFFDISPLAAFVNLEQLSFNMSKVSDLTPLSGLTKLTGLDIGFQQISDLAPLAGLTQLRWLNLRNNQIVDLSPLSGLSQLNSLDICQNQVVDLSPLQGLTSLQRLMVEGNQIEDFNAIETLLPNLQETDIPEVSGDMPGKPLHTEEEKEAAEQSENVLRKPKSPDKAVKFADKVLEAKIRQAIAKPEGIITQADAAAVTDLNLSNEWQQKFPKGTQFVKLDGIEAFINLTSLDISFNKVKDIKKIASLSSLTFFKAFGNVISDISPLAKLTSLSDLNLGGNKIQKIKALKNLTSLTALYLSGNAIKDYSPILDIYPQLQYKDFELK